MGLLQSLRKKGEEHNAEKLQREMYKTNPEYRAMSDHNSRIDKERRIISDANKKYREDGDILALIDVYEKIYIYADNSNDVYATDYKPIELANLYANAGMPDKAWGYLNSLIGLQAVPLDKVRLEQARILKKEKRHKDAIQFYMMGHKLKYSFTESVFVKDITPSANALKIKDRIPELIQIVTSAKNEHEVVIKYRAFCESGE